METVRTARMAMATRFEIVLHGENPSMLLAAAEEALDEIQRLDRQLSLYNPASQISRVNQRAAQEPVKVDPTVFELLQRCRHYTEQTGGAFDITMAPLLRCWGFMRGTGETPSQDAIARAQQHVGMLNHVDLHSRDRTVRFSHEGVMLDLGAVGKGFALESATELLRDNGITCGILHGGTSTICTLGTPPDEPAWHVTLTRPDHDPAFPHYQPPPEDSTPEEAPLAVIPLVDTSLSVSAVWGKSFQHQDRTFGHILDARTGRPSEGTWMSALVSPSATDTDALSTALLVDGLKAVKYIESQLPSAAWLLLRQGEQTQDYAIHQRNISILPVKGPCA